MEKNLDLASLFVILTSQHTLRVVLHIVYKNPGTKGLLYMHSSLVHRPLPLAVLNEGLGMRLYVLLTGLTDCHTNCKTRTRGHV